MFNFLLERRSSLEATPFARLSKNQVRRRWLPKVIVTVLEPVIGLARARLKIGLANLAYNMRRFVWLHDRRVPA